MLNSIAYVPSSRHNKDLCIPRTVIVFCANRKHTHHPSHTISCPCTAQHVATAHCSQWLMQHAGSSYACEPRCPHISIGAPACYCTHILHAVQKSALLQGCNSRPLSSSFTEVHSLLWANSMHAWEHTHCYSVTEEHEITQKPGQARAAVPMIPNTQQRGAVHCTTALQQKLNWHRKTSQALWRHPTYTQHASAQPRCVAASAHTAHSSILRHTHTAAQTLSHNSKDQVKSCSQQTHQRLLNLCRLQQTPQIVKQHRAVTARHLIAQD